LDPLNITPLEFLTRGLRDGQLDVSIEFGLESIALVRCCGDVSAATLPQLHAAIESAARCDYSTIIFDFTYCYCDEQTLKDLFNGAMERSVTVLSTTMITKMAGYWNCSVARAFRKLTGRHAPTGNVSVLDDGQPIHPPAQSDPNLQPVTDAPAPASNATVGG